MIRKPDLFLDTSALFAGVWSAEGGGQHLLKLGEVDAVQLVVSSQVLVEMERALRKKAPHQLANLAVLLECSGVKVVERPTQSMVETCLHLTGYENDAVVIAAAWSAESDYFVTLDQRHFLGNGPLASALPFPLGTPGDCLAWLRRRWTR